MILSLARISQYNGKTYVSDILQILLNQSKSLVASIEIFVRFNQIEINLPGLALLLTSNLRSCLTSAT